MIRWLQNRIFRQTLIERSLRHRMGYEWAMSILHRGKEPDPAHFRDDSNMYFEIGVDDAVFDWDNSIDADSMWGEALERTQPLPCMP